MLLSTFSIQTVTTVYPAEVILSVKQANSGCEMANRGFMSSFAQV
jgi:hypothetical protein